MAELDPTRGHEQAGIRPVLVLSTDVYNRGPADLVVAVPLTSKGKGVRWHLPVLPPEGGLTLPSFVLCDALRSLAKERCVRRLGTVTPATLKEVADRVRILLDL